jgi:hypothetical protein
MSDIKFTRSEVLKCHLENLAMRIIGPTIPVHRALYVGLAHSFDAIANGARKMTAFCAKGAGTLDVMEEIFRESRKPLH